MIQDIMINKEDVVFIPEDLSALDAIAILEDTDHRSAPVLDDSMTIYRGTIFRYHIYQYAFHHSQDDLGKIPVTQFLKNTSKVVHIEDSLFDLIFTIGDLPFIAVLNQNSSFVGIVPYTSLFDYLHQSWDLERAGYLLSIEELTSQYQTNKVLRLINRYSSILSGMTLVRGDSPRKFAIQCLLPKTLHSINFQMIVREFQKKGYTVKYWEIP